MTNHESNSDKAQFIPLLSWYHWIVLVASLFLTFFAWKLSSAQHEKRVLGFFNKESEQLIGLIQERMRSYADSLWAGVAFYNAQSSHVTYPEWLIFAQSLDLDEKYPGINGIGVIYNIPHSKLQAFLADQKKFRKEFKIHHSLNTDYWPITYVIPEEGNQAAIGLDISHEINRLQAARKARDTGKAQITGPIRLVQERSAKPGFLFYAPFYKVIDPSTLKSRRENFIGLIYAPFVVSKLVYGSMKQENRYIDMKVSDGKIVLYNEHESTSAQPRFEKLVDLNLYGRTWTFDLKTTAAFEKATANNQPIILLISGIIIDIFLFVLFLNMARSNKKAYRIAAKLEAENELQRRRVFNSSKMAALGEMAGGIAHEINNPLSVILNSAELLQMAKDESEPRNKQELIEQATDKIEKAVKRIVAIVRGLKTFTRDGAKDAFKKEELNDVILETIEFAREEFQHSSVKLEYTKGQKVCVYCQRVQISQVLINLLNNAKSAAQNSKEKVVRIEIFKDTKEKKACLKVSNSGDKIPEEIAEKIFHPLFTTKAPGEGTGLGLSISKEIINSHDGKIYLEKESPRTTFVIELPLVN